MQTNQKLSFIVVAGGIGRRMGTPVPKQFLLLRDKPILMHTLERAYTAFKHLELRLILVLHPDYFDYWHDLKKKFKFNVPVIEVSGGKERFHSVQNGLSLAFDTGIIAVHDAVRPFINTPFLQKLYNEALEKGSAVPYTLPKSSVRIEQNGENRPIPRQNVRLIQTPQMFTAKDLKQAYRRQYQPQFTDDATVYELIGKSVNLVQGLEQNIKITTEEDFVLARYFIEKN